jgi:hypothetical protein
MVIHIKVWVCIFVFSLKSTILNYYRDSSSRPIASVSSVAVGDDTTRPRRQGLHIVCKVHILTRRKKTVEDTLLRVNLYLFNAKLQMF